MALIWVTLGLTAGHSIDDYLHSDPRFVLETHLQGVHVTGLTHLSADRVRGVFAPDRNRSVQEIPLEDRQQEIAGIPWVEQVTVLRVWPNRLWIHVVEREPVAFLRVPENSNQKLERLKLIDRHGVVLDLPEKATFSLPVITGIQETMSFPERRARMKLFERFLNDVDSAEPPYSPMLSEIDLSNLRDLRATTVHEGDVIDLHMGTEQFRHRLAIFLKYVDSWKKEFGKVRSVDLRFKGHVALE